MKWRPVFVVDGNIGEVDEGSEGKLNLKRGRRGLLPKGCFKGPPGKQVKQAKATVGERCSSAMMIAVDCSVNE